MPPRAKGSRDSRSTAWTAPWLIVAAAAAAYSNSFRAPFVFDDASAIVANRTIQHLGDLGAVLSPPHSGVTAGRPLLNLTFAVNYALGGLNPLGYHAVNFAIHVAAALLLFGIIRRTSGRPLLALVAALIWALHPIQTEAVEYVSQRAESLMGLFYLLSLYAFVRRVEPGGRAKWGLLAVIACFCGMASKETMVTAPVLLFLYDRAFWSPSFKEALSKRRFLYAGLASSWLLLAALMMGYGTLSKSNAGFQTGVSCLHYALIESRALVEYLKLAFWPSPLVFDYPSAADAGAAFTTGGAAAVVFFIALIACLALASVWAWRRSQAVGFLGCSFFILLSPTSSFVPIASCPMAESRMYLPLAALTILLVMGIWRWSKADGLAGLGLLCVICAVLTFERNRDYRTPVAIWTDTLEKVPGSLRAELNLGMELSRLSDGGPDSAVHFQAVLRKDPRNASAHYGLANEWSRDPSKVEQAISEYHLAQESDPSFAEAHVNLGNLYTRIAGSGDRAIGEYRAAIRINPAMTEAHFDLGVVLADVPGKLEESVNEYGKALHIEPAFVAAEYNLASDLSRMPGRAPEAIRHYEQALRIQPDNAAVHLNLANLLATLPGREHDAISHFQAALQIEPHYPLAENNLGQIYESLGQRDEAIRHWEAALRIEPGFELARANLIRVGQR